MDTRGGGQVIYLKVGWEEALTQGWEGHRCRKEGNACCGGMTVKQRIKELNKLIVKGEAIVEDLPDVVEAVGEVIVQD